MSDSAEQQNETKKKRRRKRKKKARVGLVKPAIVLLAAAICIAFYFRADFANAQATKHLKSREFDLAKQWLDWSERIAPGNAELLFLTARLHCLNGDTEAFNQAIQQAAAANYDPARVTREKLINQAQAGQFNTQQAREILVKILSVESLHGDEEEVSEAFVIGFIRNSQYHFAKEILDVWAKDFPNNARPHYFRGVIEKEETNFHIAEEFFRKGLEINPKDAKCAYQLGSLMVYRRKQNEAIPYLKDAQLYAKDEVIIRAAQLAEAKCYRKLGDGDQARKIVTDLIKESPADMEAVLLLAKLTSDTNDYTAVVNLLKPLIKEKTRDNELRNVYAVALRETGDAAESTRQLTIIRETSEQLNRANELKQKVARDGENADYRCQIGSIFLKYGSIQEGLMWLNSAHNTNPKHVPTLAAFVEHYEQQGDERAASHFRHQLELAKRSSSSVAKDDQTPNEKQASK